MTPYTAIQTDIPAGITIATKPDVHLEVVSTLARLHGISC